MMTSEESSDAKDWMPALVERYEAALVRYAQRITGDLESARDVVQEAFLRLCREHRQQNGLADHAAGWLYTVCRRRALDLRRKEARMQTIGDSALVQQATRSDDSQLAALENRETNSQIVHLLTSLPVNQQEVLRLKFQAGLSYREISNVTSLSVTNVGYLIHTALHTLRRELAAKTAS